jgi:hypothetical protein
MTPEERARLERAQRRQYRWGVFLSTARIMSWFLAAWGFVYVAVALARVAWQA